MPKLTPTIKDELLIGSGVYDLDPGLPILASQAGLILGRNKTQMDSDRRDNKPPIAYLEGSKVVYPLGRVLEERARKQGQTIQQARDAARQAIRQGAYTFQGFISNGSLEDTWPIAMVNLQPMDFLATLGMDLDEDNIEVQEMTLEEFLVERLRLARLAKSTDDATKIGSASEHIVLPPKDRGGL